MAPVNEHILLEESKDHGIELWIKRLDKANLPIGGNKYYKLKYNLEEARRAGYNTLLTFGGAYSNHLLATAIAGKQFGFKTIGVVRGEEIEHFWEQNPTLRNASSFGMHFKFVSRSDYRNKSVNTFLTSLQAEFGAFYLLPEGGSNDLAVRGCAEILTAADHQFEYVCCCVGTGGTLAGLTHAAGDSQRILGYPALKGDFLFKDICNFTDAENWELVTDYHFGGYGHVNANLVTFINDFHRATDILLDPIYTGKMLFGIRDMLQKGFFPKGCRILAIHSGGQQAIEGMNLRLKKKNLPLIDL